MEASGLVKKLAGAGLAESGRLGFEMMERDPGFGVSQFVENARYQHALETELVRTISALRPVRDARVHLAIPKPSAFTRQRDVASASVVLASLAYNFFFLPPIYTFTIADPQSLLKNLRASIDNIDAALVFMLAERFKVTQAVDQEPAALKKIIESFAREAVASPPDTVVLFYCTGHGMQVDAENLLLGAGLNPQANESTLMASSLHFRRDVVDILPVRAQGLTITVMATPGHTADSVSFLVDDLDAVAARVEAAGGQV